MVMKAPKAQVQAAGRTRPLSRAPRRQSAETSPYVENLAQDPRFAALLRSPESEEEETELVTGGGNDPTSTDAEATTATNEACSVEQRHAAERPMEVSGDDIFTTLASSPGAVSTAAAQTGSESAAREATPQQAAPPDNSPPPAQGDAADAATKAEREKLRTPPPLVIDAVLQDLAEAAHGVSDSEHEADANATPKPQEASSQASLEQSAPEVTRPAGDASRGGRPDNTTA